jgi:malate dehydrogenase (oxaloacetate-decarboxylating)
VVLAALINSLKVAEKSIEDVKIVVNGAGAAGITIVKLLLSYGAKNVIACDTKGAIYKERTEGMNQAKS